MELSWLPSREDWGDTLRLAKSLPADRATQLLRELANSRMEFAQLGKLDRALQALIASAKGNLPGLEPLRLALLGSATTSHLVPGIRVAGLRRGLAIEVYEAPYGTYRQQLNDPSSSLYAFNPEVILFAFDARHLANAQDSTAEAALQQMRSCWQLAKNAFRCQVIQQTVLPVFPNLLGNNESRLPNSPAAIVARLNEQLRPASDAEAVDLLSIDRFAAVEGLAAWHDPAIWHRSKHEVHPGAAESYGEQVARVLAANRGKSAKCLVLDLDSTLWGGVIGDDGLEGIVLGQGSGDGEAFVEFQRYAQQLADRGVLLAVCSKNDEANALEPFDRHPEMVLKRSQIACFVANWDDKATNLRRIAKTLNIGLDALVFVDDNPVERDLIRRELPMVAVPEMPQDPGLFVRTLAAAGYFEALHVTAEDRARGELYQADAERERLRDSVTDMAGYLESLRMILTVQPFDRISLGRVTQLINKTNQFNLVTERLCETQVADRITDPRVITLQARLIDRFGDNGIIAAVIARVNGSAAVIETWVMSCRVLGRHVEEACLNVLVESCLNRGVQQLTGIYKPTAKNGMVELMYGRLGFEPMGEIAPGEFHWQLSLRNYVPHVMPMTVLDAHEAFA